MNKNKENSIGFDVLIENKNQIIFPNVCPVCMRDGQLQSAVITPSSSGWWGVWKWLFGTDTKQFVPMHLACARKLKMSLLLRQIVIQLLLLPFIGIAIYYELGRYITAIGALVIVAPALIWQCFNPPKLEVTNHSDEEINFCFADEVYAKEFAELNSSKVY